MSEHEAALGWMHQVEEGEYRPRWRLCRVAERGELEELRRLVLMPRFLCRECGRVSREESHLCKPVRLDRGSRFDREELDSLRQKAT